MEIHEVEILRDSLLVINQFKGKFKCISFTLVPFLNRALKLLDQLHKISLEHIPRERNHAATSWHNLLLVLVLLMAFANGSLRWNVGLCHPSWLDVNTMMISLWPHLMPLILTSANPSLITWMIPVHLLTAKLHFWLSFMC